MTRQLDGGYQQLSTAALEERVRLLEYRVAALTAAVQELRARCRDSRESADAGGRSSIAASAREGTRC